MRVVRIETEEGFGPLRMPRRPDFAHAWYDDPKRFPTPQFDPVLRYLIKDGYPSALKCGFIDEAQMLTWFHKNEWLAACHEADYALCVYDLDPQWVLVGQRQVLFYPRHSARIAKRALTDFL